MWKVCRQHGQPGSVGSHAGEIRNALQRDDLEFLAPANKDDHGLVRDPGFLRNKPTAREKN